LRTMAERIRGVRRRLREELERLPGSGDWAHLESQIGMFSYTGLNKGQVKRLAEKHHVYLMESGRASLSGVNDGNVEYVAKCFNEVLTCGKL
jgi:aspartate/tyrosine/aromatic aminotransferase